jgi:hypothetical protein
MAGQWESLVQPQNAVDKGRCVYYPWSWVPAGMDDRRIMSWPGRQVPPLQSQTSGQLVNVPFLRPVETVRDGLVVDPRGTVAFGSTLRKRNDYEGGIAGRSLKRRTGAEPYSNPS